MSKAVSRGQALQISARVATQVNWDELDGDRLQVEVINLTPEEFGQRFTTFLKNGARVIIGEPIIPIDRSKAFKPAKFINEDWTIAEQDERSLALTQVDLTKVRFEDCLQKGETQINGEEKLVRLKKAGHIRLDAKIFQTLWENKEFIPESWKEKINGRIRYIFFDGTILRRQGGSRWVLCLFWRDGEWRWDVRWLAEDWVVSSPSAVLEN